MDALSPRLYPQFRPGFGRYFTHALEAAKPLRLAAGFEPRWTVVPDTSNAAVYPSGTYQARVSLPARSYLWALAGYSEQAAGFELQITDLGTRAVLFSSRVNFNNATGQGTTPEGISFPLYIPPKPHLVLEPGQLSVEIRNLAAVANQIQLVLFSTHRPPEATEPPNEWNALLESDQNLAARAIHAGGSFSAAVSAPGQGGVTLPPSGGDLLLEPIEISAAGDNVILPGVGTLAIKIYALVLYNAGGLNTITLWDGVTKKLCGELTDFAAGGGLTLPEGDKPWFPLTPGNPFIIHLSAATKVSGFVKYRFE